MAGANGQLERYAVENRCPWYGIWGCLAGTLGCLGKEMMELGGLEARDVWTGELIVGGCFLVRIGW